MIATSLIIPLYNEEENLPLLHQRLTAVLTAMNDPYEIIFVDDGSQDNSLSVLQTLKANDPDHLVVVQLQVC